MDAIETPTIAPDADRAVPVTDGAGAVADEVIERLGDAIAELSARIQAATYELLALIRQFDTCGGWNYGFVSCAHWLNWRTGLDLGAAREKVRVARALASLPRISATMKRGEISYSKVRALTRIATPTNESQLLGAAQGGTASHVERLVRAWRRADRLEAARETERRHQSRHLETWVDEDGMVVIRGRLTPELGAVVQRALEAAGDRLFREARAADEDTPEVTPTQRRADALGIVAESALASDLDRGTAGDRYHVVIHVDNETLKEHAETTAAPDSGQAVMEDSGTRISAETSQRLACDASTVVMRHAPDGTVLDVGRKRRTIPPAIRRALMARDQGCQFPGCAARYCEVHHLHHWVDGGSTRLGNLALVCKRHHRAVHEEGFALTRDRDGMVRVYRPDGRLLPIAPPAPHWNRDGDADPLALLTTRLATSGIRIHGHTATPCWYGEPLDLHWALAVLRDPSVDQIEHRVDPRTRRERRQPLQELDGSNNRCVVPSSSGGATPAALPQRYIRGAD